jgi:OOP family OmpA-OmpF porin
MRLRPRFAPLALAALLAASSAAAEPIGSYFYITPFGGYTIFDGDLRFPGTNPVTDDLYAGGRLGWQFNPWLGFEAAGGFTPTAEDIGTNPIDVDFMHASGNIVWTPWQGRIGGPFVFGGGGAARLKPSSGGEDFDQGVAEFGGGLRFWLTDMIGLRLEARNLTWIPKESSQDNLNYTIFGGGLTIALGGTPRDTDGDGVADRKDKCPDTPKGATVDATGCPMDSDGDAVLDGLDQCAATPKGATVDEKGCPRDTDGDGVFDGIDTCADTPAGATVDAAGCPRDSDGDGVWDGIDKCENTPAGATVDATGCPTDSDGDGVWNGLDKCPDTSPGLKVDADGCPIQVTERETELLDTGMIRLQDINFETGKADIKPESFASLDVVGQVLTKWPELKIEIGGHTDSRGSNAANQKLSEARATSVRTYLAGKFPGLQTDQLVAKGYGESTPIAPNNNALNMAKNRRVEFVVLNKDVLKREVERRRLLPKDTAAPRPEPARPDTLQNR